MDLILIGIGHKRQVGKDTCARYLAEHYNFCHLAFADRIKDAVRVLFGFREEQLYGALKDKIDPRWGFSPRQALHWIGNSLRYGFGAAAVAEGAWPKSDQGLFMVRVLREEIAELQNRGVNLA